MTIDTALLQEIYLKKFNREKQLTTAITILVILFFYAILNVVQIPNHRRYKDANDAKDILIAKYRPQSHVEIATADPAPVEPAKIKPKVSTTIPVETPKEPDLMHLISQMDVLAEDPLAQPLQEMNKMEKPKSSKSELQIAQNEMSQLFLTAKMDNSDMGASSAMKRFTNSSGFRTSLSTMKTNADAIPRKNRDYLNSNYDTSLIEEKEKPSASRVTQVSLIKLPDDIKTKMPVIFVQISQWMKDNPVPLPDAFKKFMGYKQNHLTSRVDFKIGERYLEIYLLCIESTYEIKICLIEGNRTTLLIDEGFTHESHYLRTGKVFRTKSQEILSFGTKQEPASKKETHEFYQIFLSWWKTTGMDKL